VLELLEFRKPTDMVSAEAGGAWGSSMVGDAEVIDESDRDGLGNVRVESLPSELFADSIKLMMGALNDDDERAMDDSVGVTSVLVEDTIVD
jgi:hypothetical protein